MGLLYPSDTGDRLIKGSSSLDLQANKCRLTCVFVVESHFLLENDSAVLRHTDIILFWFKSQNMTILFANK